MDMLAYFLGRLAGGGGAGSGTVTSYKKVEYQEEDKVIFTDEEGNSYEMRCTYEDGKIKTITFQEETYIMNYDEDVLVSIGDIETNLTLAPVVNVEPECEKAITIEIKDVELNDDDILDLSGGVV